MFDCREKDYILPSSEQHMQQCVSVKQVVNLFLKQWNISSEDQLFQWLVKLHIDAYSSGTGGVETPENYKNIGFLSNTGPDPLKITKLPSHHSM